MKLEIKIGGMGFPLNRFYKNGLLDERSIREWVWTYANAGVNVWRFLPIDIWTGVVTKADVFAPYQLAGSRWNLSLWNDEYFSVMRRVFEIFREYDVTPMLELFDNCQLNGAWRENSPWHVNAQGISSFYDTQADKYSQFWIEKCFAEFPGIMFGQCNEGTEAIRRVANDVINPTFKAHDLAPFCYGACADPGNINSTLDHLKGDASKVFGDKTSLPIFRPSHKCKDAVSSHVVYPLEMWGHGHPIAIGLSDDGVFDGDSVCDWVEHKGRIERRPSAVTWMIMATKVVTEKKNDALLWFEHVPKAQDNIVCQIATFSAISEAVRNVNGHWPKNWQRWPEPVDPEPPEPEPLPDPDPVKPKCTAWYHLSRLNVRAWWAHIWGKHNVTAK